MFLCYCFRRMLLSWKRQGYNCVVLFWLVCSQFYQFLSSSKYQVYETAKSQACPKLTKNRPGRFLLCFCESFSVELFELVILTKPFDIRYSE